jgi:hypothetical protein
MLSCFILYPCWSLVPEGANLGRPGISEELPSRSRLRTHTIDAEPPPRELSYNANPWFCTQVDNHDFGEGDFRYWIKRAMRRRSDFTIEAATYTQLGVDGINIVLRFRLHTTGQRSPIIHLTQARWDEIAVQSLQNQSQLAATQMTNSLNILHVIMHILVYVTQPKKQAVVATLRQLRMESRKPREHFASRDHMRNARRYYEQYLEAVMERAAH